ncbi:class I SAM-dependent methyltransferase [Neorhizobium galegae]|nr:class I SAM-dependent methyltransferase [Neorhizobium galegae]
MVVRLEVSDEVESSLNQLISEVEQEIREKNPALLPIFDVYAEEARFGRRWLAPSLDKLEMGSSILEVGAGMMLLAVQLMREGFHVTALEPISHGFSHFDELQKIILHHAAREAVTPEICRLSIDDLSVVDTFDFAFSINVMEHVPDVASAIHRTYSALIKGGTYRFTCANYLFPYEPHFDFPTLISKTATEFVFRNRIRRTERLLDPEGVWKSLNWITVPQVRAIGRNLPNASLTFATDMLESSLERVLVDSNFAKRRSPLIRVCSTLLVTTRLHSLSRYVPAFMQPVLDCSIRKS